VLTKGEGELLPPARMYSISYSQYWIPTRSDADVLPVVFSRGTSGATPSSDRRLTFWPVTVTSTCKASKINFFVGHRLSLISRIFGYLRKPGRERGCRYLYGANRRWVCSIGFWHRQPAAHPRYYSDL